MDWYKILAKKINEYAENVADTIVIRGYNRGSSYDNRRTTTEAEKAVIKSVISGALHSVRYAGIDGHGKKFCFDSILQAAADTAEFIGDNLLDKAGKSVNGDEGVNGYDTFYLPIKNFKWDIVPEN